MTETNSYQGKLTAKKNLSEWERDFITAANEYPNHDNIDDAIPIFEYIVQKGKFDLMNLIFAINLNESETHFTFKRFLIEYENRLKHLIF